ncbi:MAG: hypothetical protein R3244_07890 [Thermoanaerobaculia bacterium]|nr:hypothetical protein [Thermoanaerobaculia bacterium]
MRASRSALDELLPGRGSWEIEIGFGRGRYLLDRAAADPTGRFLGIEMAAKYFRLVERRVRRRGLANVALLLGEALYIAGALLPPAFARAVHVYFPDPWPKDRHRKRRLLDHASVDLVLGLLEPGGALYFASDHLEYADEVEEILSSHPAIELERVERWPDGERTNYEIKYERAEREIRRLVARRREEESAIVHPAARGELWVAAVAESAEGAA